MVLEDVTELYVDTYYLLKARLMIQCTNLFSDYSGGQTKLSKILLNGNNVCMVSFPQQLFQGVLS